MKNKTDDLLTQMKEGAALTKAQRFRLVLTLSIPAILAQIASVVMGYIDAAMVGRLGAKHLHRSASFQAAHGCSAE